MSTLNSTGMSRWLVPLGLGVGWLLLNLSDADRNDASTLTLPLIWWCCAAFAFVDRNDPEPTGTRWQRFTYPGSTDHALQSGLIVATFISLMAVLHAGLSVLAIGIAACAFVTVPPVTIWLTRRHRRWVERESASNSQNN